MVYKKTMWQVLILITSVDLDKPPKTLGFSTNLLQESITIINTLKVLSKNLFEKKDK